MWFNSQFIQETEVLRRPDIDKASKSKKFDDSIAVTMSVTH
jgi:hypothetical protein